MVMSHHLMIGVVMQWLTYSEARDVAQVLGFNQSEPQIVTLFAYSDRLISEIPTRPVLIPAGNVPPSAIHQWFARIGDRLLIVECEANDPPHDSVMIRTGYLRNQDDLGDWVVLEDVQALPLPIYARRPLFIESRNTQSPRVVYRPDPQGWNTAVYRAGSQAEADSLLAFMMQDAWNVGCYVGGPSLQGQWVVVQGKEELRGTSSEMNEALRFACEWSLRYGTNVLVKDASGKSKEVFVIRQGRVLTAASP